MFKIIITDTVDDNIIEQEKQKDSYLHKILKGYEVVKLNAEQTEALKANPIKVLDNPSALYILDITEAEANSIQQDYGVMCLSSQNPNIEKLIDVNDTFVSNRKHALFKGWDTVLDSVKNLPSNALIIADRYLFRFKDPNKGDGFENVQAILEQLLPQQFKGKEYHVLILFNKEYKKNEKPAYTFSEIIKGLEIVRQQINRDYTVKMEVLGFNTDTTIHDKLHNRVIISNYYIVEAAHKIAAFNKNIATTRQTIIPLALFTESSLAGYSSAPLRAIKQNIKALQDFSLYVSKQNPEFDQYLYALNGERQPRCTRIKNRLLK